MLMLVRGDGGVESCLGAADGNGLRLAACRVGVRLLINFPLADLQFLALCFTESRLPSSRSCAHGCCRVPVALTHRNELNLTRKTLRAGTIIQEAMSCDVGSQCLVQKIKIIPAVGMILSGLMRMKDLRELRMTGRVYLPFLRNGVIAGMALLFFLNILLPFIPIAIEWSEPAGAMCVFVVGEGKMGDWGGGRVGERSTVHWRMYYRHTHTIPGTCNVFVVGEGKIGRRKVM